MLQRTKKIALAFTLTSIYLFGSISYADRCLFVSSYHPGYDWADGIERGVKKTLGKRCELRQVNMDTKRQQSEAYKVSKGLEIKALIDQWKPDVVIVADDNASKYLVQPYFKDAKIPFIFCGINWSIKEYGYPYTNVTGMIEVSPINQLFQHIKKINPKARKGHYLGANTLTEKKSFDRYSNVAEQHGYVLEMKLASDMDEWIELYQAAQSSDFIIIGTESGILGWDKQKAHQSIMDYGKVLSLTTYNWMMEYSAVGFTKVAEEHGEWAAKVALKILEGTPASRIPIIPSQRWDIFINPQIIEAHKITLPEALIIKSKKHYAE